MGCPHPKKLADYHAGRLDVEAGAAVEAHLAACRRCRTAELRTSGALDALREIRDGGLPTPAPASPARIEATLRWTRKTPRYVQPARLWKLGVALSAAAAAAVLVAWKPWRHPQPPSVSAPPPAPMVAVEKPAPPRPQALGALVTLVGGEAAVARGGAPEQLDPRRLVLAGDAIATGGNGRVGLQWGEGSGALIGPRSSLTVARLEPLAQELALQRGEVAVRVGPHQPGEALRVLSPDHTVTVHGTYFVVATDGRGTTVEVLEGVVEVAAREGDGTSTRVAAPERAFFPRGKGTAKTARPLTGREAAALRQANEMGLLVAWTTPETALAQTGLVDVQTTPPAALVVDGVPYGATPLSLRRVLGRHLVELSRSGFSTVRRWIDVGPEPGELHLALLPSAEEPESVPPAEDEVQQVVKSRMRHVRACYDHVLKRDPTLAGSVTMTLKVGPAGQVLRTSVKDNTIGDEVTTCLQHEVAGWVFPSARNAAIEYPFTFQRQ